MANIKITKLPLQRLLISPWYTPAPHSVLLENEYSLRFSHEHGDSAALASGSGDGLGVDGLFSHSVMYDSCDPIDCSLLGSSVHGILQVRILEWIVISFSRGSSRPWN